MPVVKLTMPSGDIYSNGGPEAGVKHLDEGGFDPHLIEMLTETVQLVTAMLGVGNTSTTNMVPGTGAKTFTADQAPKTAVGNVIAIQSSSDPQHYMKGDVTAINGNDIDVNVTIANGGAAMADWVITHPAPGIITNATGDIMLTTGSISTTGADADFGAGGNRALMDQAGAVGRFGAVPGGGGAVQTQLMVAGSQMITSDANSNHKNIDGGNRFNGGNELYLYDHGTVSSGTVAVSWTGADYQKILMGGNLTLDFLSPDAPYVMVKTLFLHNDGTGGRVITVNRDGLITQIKWVKPEPNWASLPANSVVRVVAQYNQLDGWLYLAADVGMHS